MTTMSQSANAVALVLASLYNRLATITEALEGAGWQVRAFQNPREALEVLRQGGIEAVFCDEYLRGASPSGFLAWTRRLAPKMPFYLFTIDEQPQRITGSHQPDSLLSFPPSHNTVPLPAKLTSLGDVRMNAKELPLEGNTGLVPLADLIEMMGISNQSSIIAIEAGRLGLLYLDEGALVHAISHRSRAQGVRALAEMLRLGTVEFEVRDFDTPLRKTIHLPTATAITEATRLIDEKARDQDLVELVRSGCESADTVVIGYPLAQAPSFGMGDTAEVFEIAKGLLEKNRAQLRKITHLSIETKNHSYALALFGEGNLVAGRAARGKSLLLMAAIVKAVKGQTAQFA